jgi:hypothetical protein
MAGLTRPSKFTLWKAWCFHLFLLKDISAGGSLGACWKNQESQKTGNQKPFDAIKKLVRGQMWAKIFSAKSFCPLFRQAPRGILSE